MGINVSSTITINTDVLQELSDIGKQALVKTADAMLTQVKNAEVMPFDTGTLQNDSTAVDASDAENGNVRIVSSTPYARKVYFHPEYNFQTVNNRFAGAYWFKPWMGSGSRRDFVAKAFAIHYRRLLKNALRG